MPGRQVLFTHDSKPVHTFPSSQSAAARQQSGTRSCMHPIPWSQKSVVQGEWSSQSTGACWQPKTSSQVSVLHALPSLQSSPMGAGWHMPVAVSQVSAPSQTVALVQSESCRQQPGTGPWSHILVVSLHESVVHTTWSSQSTGVPSHCPVARLQVSTPLQKSPSLHVSVWPQACAPVSQVSCVQATPSSQSASVLQQPSWRSKWHMPVIGSQLSSVQTSLSLQTTSGASRHSPVAVLQVSTPVQRSPSEHCASLVQHFGMGSLTQAPWPPLAMGSQLSAVQTMPSSQVGGGTMV